jgi:hypothetical protein
MSTYYSDKIVNKFYPDSNMTIITQYCDPYLISLAGQKPEYN